MSVLQFLIGKVRAYYFIQENVWEYETMDNYQLLRVFMISICCKIELNSFLAQFIITEVGVGYWFAEEWNINWIFIL